jgi:hypothetical protein
MNIELFLARADAFLDALRALPVDALLLVSAGAILFQAMSIIARFRAMLARKKMERRTIALESEVDRLRADGATSRKALDTERQWRMAAEKAVALIAAKPTLNVSPLPPRELHELLEREYPETPGAAPVVKVDAQDVAPATGRSRIG